MTLICATCGNAFTGRPNRRYCSAKCRRKAEREVRNARRRAEMDQLYPGIPCMADLLPDMPTMAEVCEQLQKDGLLR